MRKAALLGAAVVVTMLATSCGSHPGPPGATTGTTGDTGPTGSSGSTGDSGTATTTTAAVPDSLTISGTGPALQVSIEDNGSLSQHTNIALPYTTTLSDSPSIMGIDAQTASSNPTATLTCTIEIPGQQPVTNTSTGAYTTVDCTGSTLP